ncbi:interferon-induced GTP-binding protein Mx [Xylariomycetidae sp. FL0641]|nr:interferon-induced GTP-binding protein Mx [Xylariomycetidae sp. FL0641]
MDRDDHTAGPLAGIEIPSTIGELQSDEHRAVLDAVLKLRKCGLERELSLPQIAVGGDQSAGKSSLLEALTGILFPWSDNVCTRFPTEIDLRCESKESLTIRIIPNESRSKSEQENLRKFSKSIADLTDLPKLMEDAVVAMGISTKDAETSRSFAKDVLSIEICGPSLLHLTFVDIPGLIQSSTGSVPAAEIAVASEITDRYISRHRTICLAVISGTYDAANQSILQRARKYDPSGERTLGVITKVDMCPPGSGAEANFISLARNEDVSFKLGWHVIKNRRFEESHFTLQERNESESEFFRTSNFKSLPRKNVGIDSLRAKLSHIHFEHVRNELPGLRDDLERTLESTRSELAALGSSRSTPTECRMYLSQFLMDNQEVSKAAVNGHYENEYFKDTGNATFCVTDKSTIARLRAEVQYMNNSFAETLREKGHKYQFPVAEAPEQVTEEEEKLHEDAEAPSEATSSKQKAGPQMLTKKDSEAWVKQMLLRSRGTELIGNFNPHLIGELFWEQSSKWEELAGDHITAVRTICERFLTDLINAKAPPELKTRLWSSLVPGEIKMRHDAAFGELQKLIQDKKEFPINYNHYYTENMRKTSQERLKWRVHEAMPEPKHSEPQCRLGGHYEQYDVKAVADRVVAACTSKSPPDMETCSCEEILDCLLAIYKVQQKTFQANVVTQVIERHLLRDLGKILSPLIAIHMSDAEITALVAEAPATTRKRRDLTDRIKKLEEGQEIFRQLGVFAAVPV